MNRRTLVLGLGAAGALLAAACGGSNIDEPSSQVFTDAPWDGEDQYTYQLEQADRIYGACVASTLPDGDTTTLTLECDNGEGDEDNRSVTVETDTLVPLESTRTTINGEENTETVTGVDYHPPTATIHSLIDGDERARDRDLPTKDNDDDPEPGYYDDNEIFWLFRGIPLEEGWKGAYHNVNPGALVHITKTEVEVVEREDIEVPAGTIDSWRIRFRTESSTHYIWIEVAEPHRVVQAQLEDVRFKLTDE